MLTGFNTDFKYKGTIYHVQTEDNGVNNPSIVTLLYKGGAILASRKTSYADILKFDRLEKVVKDLMKEQHKQVIKDLVAGKLESDVGIQPQPKQAAEAAPTAEITGFGADIISDKGLDQVILDYLSSQEEET